jgi:hypothetical protein
MTHVDPLEDVREVARRLDELATALARPDLDAVLRLEDQLRAATTALRRVDGRTLPPGSETREALERAARALARCRRLGVLLTDVLRVAGAAYRATRLADTYGPDGRTGAVATTPALAAHF